MVMVAQDHGQAAEETLGNIGTAEARRAGRFLVAVPQDHLANDQAELSDLRDGVFADRMVAHLGGKMDEDKTVDLPVAALVEEAE